MMNNNLFIVWLNINKATPTKIPTNILCPKLADLIFECTNGVVSKNIIKHDKGIENFINWYKKFYKKCIFQRLSIF